jgi:hypothetical protein
MERLSTLVTLSFGCVVATGVVALPGPYTLQKTVGVAVAALAVLLVGLVLFADIRSRS